MTNQKARPVAEPVLDPDQRRWLAEFWRVYDAQRKQVQLALQTASAGMQELADTLKRLPQPTPEQEARSRELQRLALEEGNWRPWLDELHEQGARYAQAGVPFKVWFQLISVFRRAVRDSVLAEVKALEDLTHHLDAMNLFIDTAMASIGESYLATKERIIQQQQEAIRELSTPVLQVHDRLLIIPLVGVVDTRRARHLTDAMLRSIRERRARVVVMDITGVPIVDSKVANHLAQACEAARLMGARVILTGVSAEIAQALVTLGAELRGVETLGDLQTGIEEAQRHLGLFVSASPPPSPSSPSPALPGVTG